MNRRNFIKNSAGILIAAPMVVKSESLMKICVPPKTQFIQVGGFYLGNVTNESLFAGDTLRVALRQMGDAIYRLEYSSGRVIDAFGDGRLQLVEI